MPRARMTQTARATPGAGTTDMFGGPTQATGSKPGKRNMQFGDEVYLWILVALEVGLMAHFRNLFSRYHGG